MQGRCQLTGREMKCRLYGDIIKHKFLDKILSENDKRWITEQTTYFHREPGEVEDMYLTLHTEMTQSGLKNTIPEEEFINVIRGGVLGKLQVDVGNTSFREPKKEICDMCLKGQSIVVNGEINVTLLNIYHTLNTIATTDE